MPQFPIAVINYAVYSLDQIASYLGMADMTLSDVQHEVASIKGAGVFGTIDHPILGHTTNLTTTLNFHTPNRDAIRFMQQRGRQIEARAAMEIYDSAAGDIDPHGMRFVMRTLPQGLTLGSLEVAAASGTSVTLTVTSLTIYDGDDRVFEHDKFGGKFEIEGTDFGQRVRSILGF